MTKKNKDEEKKAILKELQNGSKSGNTVKLSELKEIKVDLDEFGIIEDLEEEVSAFSRAKVIKKVLAVFEKKNPESIKDAFIKIEKLKDTGKFIIALRDEQVATYFELKYGFKRERHFIKL